MNRFTEKVVAITGGAAGIGLATARRVIAEGGRVALLDWSKQDLQSAGEQLREGGADIIARQGDVSRREDCEALVEGAMARWGRVDAMIANAAIRAYGSALDAPDEEWDRVLAVNLRGAAHACIAGARAIKQGGEGGAIVLIASIGALEGRADMPIYDATKAALLSLTRSLAVDLARSSIRVNSICPGFTVTDYHVRRAAAEGRPAAELRQLPYGLLRRGAEPEEIAAAIAFLASSDASYITATNLMVDAGRHAV